jgi:hypothetical protein
MTKNFTDKHLIINVLTFFSWYSVEKMLWSAKLSVIVRLNIVNKTKSI